MVLERKLERAGKGEETSEARSAQGEMLREKGMST